MNLKVKKNYEQNYIRATKGTGKLFLFAADQKIEHLNKDFYGPRIDKADLDPEHLFKIASKGNVGAMATQLGLISLYGQDYKEVNYVVKMNSKTDLVTTKQMDPRSFSLNEISDLVKFKKRTSLNIIGIGYTIYLGSQFEGQMLCEASRLIFDAHENGLLAILWIYPRGKAVKNETGIEMISGASGVAACLGADFVKINPPKAQSIKRSAQLLKRAVIAAGRTGIICSGGKQKRIDMLLSEILYQVDIGGARGVAIGRNLHQRSLSDAIELCNSINKILKK